MPASRDYVVISPCRNEAEYMRQTLDTMVGQTVIPKLWVIVDDGSTDETPAILAEYTAKHDWIRVVAKPDRGHRAVGPGVIEAFYAGVATIDLNDYTYLCKLDLDLALPLGYFEELMRRMEDNPRIGTCSGKAYFEGANGQMISEKIGDEMSLGMTKFYRTSCFEQIGGFVREVMWDGLDCHKARKMGWIAVSWDMPELRFNHLRAMGSSQSNIYVGRRRHGFGQYYMGSDFTYFFLTAVKKMLHPPYILGGAATVQGYLAAMFKGEARHEDRDLTAYIRTYQRRALVMGKGGSIKRQEDEAAHLWAQNPANPAAS